MKDFAILMSFGFILREGKGVGCIEASYKEKKLCMFLEFYLEHYYEVGFHRRLL